MLIALFNEKVQPYGLLSNFATTPFKLKNKTWDSVTQYVYVNAFTKPDLQQQIAKRLEANEAPYHALTSVTDTFYKTLHWSGLKKAMDSVINASPKLKLALINYETIECDWDPSIENFYGKKRQQLIDNWKTDQKPQKQAVHRLQINPDSDLSPYNMGPVTVDGTKFASPAHYAFWTCFKEAEIVGVDVNAIPTNDLSAAFEWHNVKALHDVLVKNAEDAIAEKFKTHHVLLHLLNTSNLEIVWDDPTDPVLGIGDGLGQNITGKILMTWRAKPQPDRRPIAAYTNLTDNIFYKNWLVMRLGDIYNTMLTMTSPTTDALQDLYKFPITNNPKKFAGLTPVDRQALAKDLPALTDAELAIAWPLMISQIETLKRLATDYDLVNVIVRAQKMYMLKLPTAKNKRSVKEYLTDYFNDHSSMIKSTDPDTFVTQILTGRPLTDSTDMIEMTPRIFYWVNLSGNKTKSRSVTFNPVVMRQNEDFWKKYNSLWVQQEPWDDSINWATAIANREIWRSIYHMYAVELKWDVRVNWPALTHLIPGAAWPDFKGTNWTAVFNGDKLAYKKLILNLAEDITDNRIAALKNVKIETHKKMVMESALVNSVAVIHIKYADQDAYVRMYLQIIFLGTGLVNDYPTEFTIAKDIIMQYDVSTVIGWFLTEISDSHGYLVYVADTRDWMDKNSNIYYNSEGLVMILPFLRKDIVPDYIDDSAWSDPSYVSKSIEVADGQITPLLIKQFYSVLATGYSNVLTPPDAGFAYDSTTGHFNAQQI